MPSIQVNGLVITMPDFTARVNDRITNHPLPFCAARRVGGRQPFKFCIADAFGMRTRNHHHLAEVPHQLLADVRLASAPTAEGLIPVNHGAFVAGTLMPPELRQPLLDRLQVATVGLLMPFFFMLTGLRTMIDLGSPGFVDILVLAVALGVLGKVGGTAIAARLVGESWATGFSLGALVQTNGLMGLIVLTILLDRGIITTSVFSALVLMGVFTTLLAMPMTRLAQRYERPQATASPAMPALAPVPVEDGVD